MNPDLSDELSAINSIYGPSTLQPASASTSIYTSQTETYILQIPHPSSPLIALRISFPPSYPAQPPSILGVQTSPDYVAPTTLLQLVRDALEKVYTPSTVVFFDFIEEIPRILDLQTEQLGSEHPIKTEPTTTAAPADQTSQHGEEEMQVYRCVFYFHHIYSSKKIRHLHDLAQTYKLSGVMKTSRPGFLFAETMSGGAEDGDRDRAAGGKKEELESFVKEVKGMRWQEVKMMCFEAIAVPGPEKGASANAAGSEKQRRGKSGRDKEDGAGSTTARLGFMQVEKMSDFSAWMHERGLGEMLKESVLR